MKPVRYGVIGTGWIVERFIQSAATVNIPGSAEPALLCGGVCSRDRSRGEAFAGRNGIPQVFTSPEELAGSDLEAVYIASPNALHYPQSRLCLSRGKHVLCEKPAAASPDQVRELLSLARERGLTYMEAMMTTRLPQMELLRQALPSLGRISFARFSFCQLSSKYPLLEQYDRGEGPLPNIFNPALETGAVMDIGIYCVYPALALFGLPERLSAHAVRHENGIDLCGTAVLSYPDKLVELSYSKIAEGRALSEVQGDQGTLLLRQISQLVGLERIDRQGNREELFRAPEGELPMRHEAARFYGCIRSPENHCALYEEDGRLAVDVSGILQQIRGLCGMPF